MSRPERPCVWCGRRTTATDCVCLECVGVDRRAGHTPTPRDELRGGRWVNRGLVRVWEPHRTKPEPIICPGDTLEDAAGLIVAEIQRRAAIATRDRDRSARGNAA